MHSNALSRIIFGLLALLWLPTLAHAQGAYVPVKTVTSSVNGVLKGIQATLTVCAANTAGLPCAPALANTLFKDSGLTVPLANPTTTDALGNYPQMALAAGVYTITETAAGFTGFSYQLSVSCAVGATCTATSLTLTGSLSVSGAGTLNNINGCQYINANQTFAQALAAATNPGCIEVSTGTYTVSTNATIPLGISLRSSSGGILSIANAVTLTINGLIWAPPQQIFAFVGTGAVSIGGPATIIPQWFPGADIGVQWSNAVLSVASTTTPATIQIPPGAYSFSNAITIGNKHITNLAYGANLTWTGGASKLITVFPPWDANDSKGGIYGLNVIGNASVTDCFYVEDTVGYKIIDSQCSGVSGATSGLHLDNVVSGHFSEQAIIQNDRFIGFTNCINMTVSGGGTSFAYTKITRTHCNIGGSSGTNALSIANTATVSGGFWDFMVNVDSCTGTPTVFNMSGTAVIQTARLDVSVDTAGCSTPVFLNCAAGNIFDVNGTIRVPGSPTISGGCTRYINGGQLGKVFTNGTADVSMQRWEVNGTAPSCAVTGAGTGATCTVDAGSTDSLGQMIINTGTTPAALGTITLTYAAAFTTSNASSCALWLNAGASSWNARATIIGNGSMSLATVVANWDNNAVALAASQASSVKVSYVCGGR